MPNVVPEAYGCGVPVIMTPFIGLPQEFGRAGDHYELVERTPGAIAQSISSLLDNRERGRQLALRARKLVEDEMDVEKSLDRYAALYRDLAMRSKKH